MRQLVTTTEQQLGIDIENAKQATEVVKKDHLVKIDKIRTDVSDKFTTFGSKVSDVEMKLEMINNVNIQ